ncbi:golgin subfamily A member 6-like protein 25 [Lytechinus pictus]|uniref:golgin subfamily A member 6-like protein 25 n=1 Tax=Lytechinus pictus TaxID=7653 RepID=UPI0030B9CB8E
MEKEVIKCIRDIKFQTQNEGRCTCADENELKTTMDKQRDEIISLKECINQLKSEINIRVNEYELLLKEQRLVVKSKEQELNMHKKYNENEEKKSNKLQSELDQTVEQLKMAKKEIDKFNEENINIKRQWQASESDGEWREQKRYAHTRGRKEGRDDEKWSEYRGMYHRGDGQWRERKRIIYDRREEGTYRRPIYKEGEQKRYSLYSEVAAPYRDVQSRDRPRNGQRREISPQRNARNKGNERTTEGMNEIHEERNKHECDMSREQHNKYDGSRGQMNDRNEKKMRKVVIVGNSQISGIDPDKFSQNVKLHKVIKYTMDDVESWLKSSEAKQTLSDAETVIIHELTNDVKRSSALDCACKMNNLIGLIKVSFKSIKIVISLGTPRDDNQLYQQRVDMANSMLMADALYDRRVKTVHHRNLLYRGTINTNLYSDDRYHLSKNGTRVLAGNLRWAIERSSSRNKR